MSEAVRLVFRRANDTVQEIDGAVGDSMLRAAQAAGLPLEGTCEGQMACSTCHVLIDPEWFDLATVNKDVGNALKPNVKRRLHQPKPRKT